MKYYSTRGYGGENGKGVCFNAAMLDGLAPDGGLYLPESYPQFDLAQFKGKTFLEVAEVIMAPFVEPDIGVTELRELLEKAYKKFDDPQITPSRNLADNHTLLELYHGSTLAFKDIALQLLGHLLDHALAKKHQNLTVLGATSGDTGPAAIEGMKGRDHIRTVMLFPHGRVSEVQRRQMTAVGGENVHPVAVKGTFDDCQKLVKTLFAEDELRGRHNLTAINSISWARLLPQMVYYFYAWSQLEKPLVFSVPTGNFGDVFAGYMAKRCGLPIKKLIVASNSNDILTRFVNNGDYSLQGVHATQSPSMDISVASNFERYLYELTGRDPDALSLLMRTFSETGTLPSLTQEQMATVRKDFAAVAANEEQTTATIKKVYEQTNTLIDPHTAVGVFAAQSYLKENPGSHVITLATAHPAKFADAVKAATGQAPALPERLAHIMEAEEQFDTIPADADALKKLMNR